MREIEERLQREKESSSGRGGYDRDRGMDRGPDRGPDRGREEPDNWRGGGGRDRDERPRDRDERPRDRDERPRDEEDWGRRGGDAEGGDENK